MLFIGIVPLLAFVIVDSFAGLKSALITAVIFALFEVAFSIYFLGMVDWITAISVGLVLILSFVSWRFKSSLHFKLQPVILSGALGIIFLVSYWMGHPLLVEFIDKYASELPAEIQMRFSYPPMRQLLSVSSHFIGYAFVAHGALTGWSAFKLSNWWWIVIRGLGFYIFQIIALFAAKFSLGY